MAAGPGALRLLRALEVRPCGAVFILGVFRLRDAWWGVVMFGVVGLLNVFLACGALFLFGVVGVVERFFACAAAAGGVRL